nr:hypothetical protein [uncultured Undibacterium sp.]
MTKPQPPIVPAPKSITQPDGSATKPDDSKPVESKPDEKKEEKKEEKKDVIEVIKSGTPKKEEPVKKLYCN